MATMYYDQDADLNALKGKKVAIIGYGSQGHAQALNLRDSGINVIVAELEGTANHQLALEHGFKPVDAAAAAGDADIIQILVPDDAQAKMYHSSIASEMSRGTTLLFSHGFNIHFNQIVPPEDSDVIMVAPKGPGHLVRREYERGAGVPSLFAVFQDFTGRAKERTLAVGIAIGSGYLFPTTFKKEVHSDLTGERGVLMGALAGMMEAQYNELRKHGHSPSEAFNETVEELTQSLIRLVGENGMDWMYANCSATAQRGALDWRHKFRKAVEPVFSELYKSVVDGVETKIVLEANSALDYQEKLGEELKEMRESEMWQAGAAVRSLRPENWGK